DEATVPVAGVEPVAAAQRMVAAVRPAAPARGLAAGEMLARHPPLRDLLGPGRIREIEDDDDVADEPVLLGRDVGVAAVAIEAMRAARAVMADLARPGLVRNVVDLDAAGEVGRPLAAGGAVELVVHQHDVA